MEIILASQSPRRKEILSLLDIPFKIMVSDADETVEEGLPAHFIAESLSLKKAASVAENVKTPSIIIGADTIVLADGKILGKPKDPDDAKEMLSLLSGKWHKVISGVTVFRTTDAKSESFYVETKVKFSNLSEREINDYIATNEPCDKAGAYAIQGKGAKFIEQIEGDYFNVVGLPLSKLYQVLKKEFNIF
jgi:septum formation protein